MFLKTQRKIVWKSWPALSQWHSFPCEKSKDWEGKMAHFVWHFQKQESFAAAWAPSQAQLTRGKCGCEVITVRIYGEKLSSGDFSKILEALCIIPPAGFLVEIFPRVCCLRASGSRKGREVGGHHLLHNPVINMSTLAEVVWADWIWWAGSVWIDVVSI